MACRHACRAGAAAAVSGLGCTHLLILVARERVGTLLPRPPIPTLIYVWTFARGLGRVKGHAPFHSHSNPRIRGLRANAVRRKTPVLLLGLRTARDCPHVGERERGVTHACMLRFEGAQRGGVCQLTFWRLSFACLTVCAQFERKKTGERTHKCGGTVKGVMCSPLPVRERIPPGFRVPLVSNSFLAQWRMWTGGVVGKPSPNKVSRAVIREVCANTIHPTTSFCTSLSPPCPCLLAGEGGGIRKIGGHVNNGGGALTLRRARIRLSRAKAEVGRVKEEGALPLRGTAHERKDNPSAHCLLRVSGVRSREGEARHVNGRGTAREWKSYQLPNAENGTEKIIAAAAPAGIARERRRVPAHV